MSTGQLACLIRLYSGDNVRAHVVSLNAFTLGRSTDSAIPLLSTSISRQHVQVEISDKGILLTDLNSNNGTLVDGNKLPPGRKVRLKPSNRVQLGAFPEVMTFEAIPLPMELLNVEDQRKQMNDIMLHLRKELEDETQKHLAFELERLNNKATSDYKRLMLQADGEIQKIKRDNDGYIRKSLEDSQKQNLELIRQAEEEARLIQDMGLANEMKRKTELQEKMDAIERQAFEDIAKTKAESQHQAESLLTDTRAKIASEIQAAQSRSEKIVKDAEALFQKRVQDAEILNQKSLDEARRLSSEIQQRAIAQQDKVLADARERAQMTMQKAETEAVAIEKAAHTKATQMLEQAAAAAQREVEELREDFETSIAQQKENAIRDAQREHDRMIADAKKAALTEQEKIVASFQDPVDKLRVEKKNLEENTKTARTELTEITQKKERFEIHYKELEQKIVDATKDIASLKDEVKKAEALVAEGQASAIERDTMLAARDQAKAKLDRYQREFNEGVHALEAEMKSRKEQATRDFETFKQSIEEKSATQHLHAMESIKTRIKAEEAKYAETLRLRSLELSEAVEGQLRAQLGELAPQGLTEIVQKAVSHTIVTQNSAVRAVTEHLGIDPVKEASRRKKIRQATTAAAVAGLVLVAVFHQSIFEHLKNSGASGLSEYLVAKRTAESIYSPAQNDDWRETYVGNVLYLRNYAQAKKDPVYQEQWTLRLNQVEFLRSIGLNEDDIIKYQAKEGTLLETLSQQREALDARFLDDGLKTMNEAEQTAVAEMREILKTEENFNTVRGLERDFTLQYMKRRFGHAKENDTRTPADND